MGTMLDQKGQVVVYLKEFKGTLVDIFYCFYQGSINIIFFIIIIIFCQIKYTVRAFDTNADANMNHLLDTDCWYGFFVQSFMSCLSYGV